MTLGSWIRRLGHHQQDNAGGLDRKEIEELVANAGRVPRSVASSPAKTAPVKRSRTVSGPTTLAEQYGRPAPRHVVVNKKPMVVRASAPSVPSDAPEPKLAEVPRAPKSVFEEGITLPDEGERFPPVENRYVSYRASHVGGASVIPPEELGEVQPEDEDDTSSVEQGVLPYPEKTEEPVVDDEEVEVKESKVKEGDAADKSKTTAAPELDRTVLVSESEKTPSKSTKKGAKVKRSHTTGSSARSVPWDTTASPSKDSAPTVFALNYATAVRHGREYLYRYSDYDNSPGESAPARFVTSTKTTESKGKEAEPRSKGETKFTEAIKPVESKKEVSKATESAKTLDSVKAMEAQTSKAEAGKSVSEQAPPVPPKDVKKPTSPYTPSYLSGKPVEYKSELPSYLRTGKVTASIPSKPIGSKESTTDADAVKKEGEEKAKKEADEKAAKEAAEKKTADEKAAKEAAEKKAADEKAKKEAEEKAKKEAEEKAAKEAEEKKAAEEKAAKEAEAKKAAEEKAAKEAEEKKAAEEKAAKEAEAKKAAEEKAAKEAEEKKAKEAAEKKAAEEKAAKEAEEKKAKEAAEKKAAEEKAAKEAEEKKAKEAAEKKAAEEKAAKEAEEKKAKEAAEKKAAEEKAAKEADAKLTTKPSSKTLSSSASFSIPSSDRSKPAPAITGIDSLYGLPSATRESKPSAGEVKSVNDTKVSASRDASASGAAPALAYASIYGKKSESKADTKEGKGIKSVLPEFMRQNSFDTSVSTRAIPPESRRNSDASARASLAESAKPSGLAPPINDTSALGLAKSERAASEARGETKPTTPSAGTESKVAASTATEPSKATTSTQSPSPSKASVTHSIQSKPAPSTTTSAVSEPEPKAAAATPAPVSEKPTTKAEESKPAESKPAATPAAQRGMAVHILDSPSAAKASPAPKESVPAVKPAEDTKAEEKPALPEKDAKRVEAAKEDAETKPAEAGKDAAVTAKPAEADKDATVPTTESAKETPKDATKDAPKTTEAAAAAKADVPKADAPKASESAATKPTETKPAVTKSTEAGKEAAEEKSSRNSSSILAAFRKKDKKKNKNKKK